MPTNLKSHAVRRLIIPAQRRLLQPRTPVLLWIVLEWGHDEREVRRGPKDGDGIHLHVIVDEGGWD